jgi:hypothetical protein
LTTSTVSQPSLTADYMNVKYLVYHTKINTTQKLNAIKDRFCCCLSMSEHLTTLGVLVENRVKRIDCNSLFTSLFDANF